MKSAPVGELISSYLRARPLALSGEIIHNKSYPFSFCLVHGIHTRRRTSFLSPLIKHHLGRPCLLEAPYFSSLPPHPPCSSILRRQDQLFSATENVRRPVFLPANVSLKVSDTAGWSDCSTPTRCLTRAGRQRGGGGRRRNGGKE